MKVILLISFIALAACSNSGGSDKKDNTQVQVSGYSCDNAKSRIAALGSPTTLTKIQEVFELSEKENPTFTEDLIAACLDQAYTKNCQGETCYIELKPAK